MNHQLLQSEIFFPDWPIKTLVLGTFNPDCGEKVDYFYGRCRNNFWRAIEHIEELDYRSLFNNLNGKIQIMEKYHFGCTDIISSIEFNPNIRNKICGEGYSDSVLFTKKFVKIHYQFDQIIDFIAQQKVKKVIHTWGTRKNPREFKILVQNFNDFCNRNHVEFIADCPSPSPRSRNNINTLIEFYREHLI